MFVVVAAISTDTLTLWRPTGPEELALVEATGSGDWTVAQLMNLRMCTATAQSRPSWVWTLTSAVVRRRSSSAALTV